MQGGYNGWHNDVACNLMTPLEALGPRVSPGEYPFLPISAGIPDAHKPLVHPINFNDLDSVRWVCERYPIACLITEPILQNIGLVHPKPGYLAGLRKLADEFGFVLIFDEVKTGFRHALGGYAQISGVRPDLAVYGKAIANGYPIAALGGKKALMDYFVHPDPAKRVLLAGTYNAHRCRPRPPSPRSSGCLKMAARFIAMSRISARAWKRGSTPSRGRWASRQSWCGRVPRTACILWTTLGGLARSRVAPRLRARHPLAAGNDRARRVLLPDANETMLDLGCSH
jgi:hypothetical protein